uniref:Uncharacterized protein n=1 Tax=viral metagenome TaxID=1070528 RepID=A0A2V0RLU3_9ZZZZ
MQGNLSPNSMPWHANVARPNSACTIGYSTPKFTSGLSAHAIAEWFDYLTAIAEKRGPTSKAVKDARALIEPFNFLHARMVLRCHFVNTDQNGCETVDSRAFREQKQALFDKKLDLFLSNPIIIMSADVTALLQKFRFVHPGVPDGTRITVVSY